MSAFDHLKSVQGTHWDDCWKSHPECAYYKGRMDGLEAATKACEDEFLEKPTTNMEDDAYNAAIGHCLAAIRELKDE